MKVADAIRSGEFDGCWCGQNGEAIASIVGHEITFTDGFVTKLDAPSSDVVCMVLEGEVFSAMVDSPGFLKWNDGDIWMLCDARQQKELLLSAIEKQKPLAGTILGAGKPKRAPSSSSSSTVSASRPAHKVRKATPPEILVEDPGKYHVVQGVVFKKPGLDPTIDRGIKKIFEVGTVLKTTGRSWVGKHRSTWVELDCPTSPGWVLVQGDGVDMPGPLLQIVEDGEEPPCVLRARAPYADDSTDTAQEERKFLLRPSSLVSEVKMWLSLLFKLTASEIKIRKPQEELAADDNDEPAFVQDSLSLREAGFCSGSLLNYTHLNFLAD